ncbi:hypothetical protein BG006_001300 [Podila minutissima]|uniref:Uncharacterized protein n=1 Tax=Podila minutissima TaxID=64525 RepID=A0A9P5VNT1_9FUNG|nr:hypothetical protein BG006_001300 [Podila minutissima]
MSTTSSTFKSPSSPPPVHSHQGPYNIRRIHKVHAGASRINSSPSIRQSWLFPTNRASPSTALPETTSVMTLNQRPQNIRSEHPPLSTSSSSAAAAYAVSPTLSSNSAMHQKRNFSGSARSRLSKIDRLSKMMLNPNASAPSLLDTSSPFPPSSPRRARLSQVHKDTSSAPDPSLSPLSSLSSESNSGTKGAASSSNICPSPHQHISAQTSYPRHIIMRSSSPHRALDNTTDGDALSSSLPSASAFPDGVEISTGNSTSTSNDKSGRHTSMPLPRPGWRLYDVLDQEDSDSQHDHDGSGSGFGSSGTDDHHSFHYSASNASSTSNLAHHGRQESISSFYTATPNASNLDLSFGSSLNNLNTLDNSTTESHLSTSPSQTSYASSYNLPPPPQLLPKAVRNNKSPLALKRSSTMSNSSVSLSSTNASKGSMPKSSLSNDAILASKTLTLERQKFIVEILRTERSYVDGLVVLQTLFYEPLNASHATNSNSGMNTTTSFSLNTTHSYKYNNNSISSLNNTSNHNINTGPTPTSPYYATSTMGSNSTLSAAAAPLLSKKSVNEIFSNFSEILQVNTLLLTQLETRICGTTFSTGWESDEDEEGDREGPDEDQEDEDPEGIARGRKPDQVLVTVGSQGGEQEQLLVLDQDWCVGDIFIEIAPFLKMYSNYVKTYTSALAHINDCMTRSDRFTEFVKTTSRRPECKNLDFQSYLMLPVQRIPRYRMLLEGLLRHTPEDHPDHRKLETAFRSMEKTANFVNETIRQHEMFGEMVNLQSKIAGLNERLIIPGRALLKRGNVWKICRRNVQQRLIILFSDCILWTSPSLNPLDETLTFHRKVELENCTVIGVDGPDPTKNAFQIMSPDKSSQVYVETLREKEAWMEAIRKAKADYLLAKTTLKISITPMQSISAAATSFGAGLLKTGRETAGGLWSPQLFNSDSRAFTFGGHQSADHEGGGTMSSMDGGPHNSMQARPQPLRVVENYNAPVWIPDQSATRCMICKEEFGTLIRRKHHCRACGKVTILIKAGNSEKEGRACDECIDTMFPEEAHVAPVKHILPSPEPSPVEANSPHHSGIESDRRVSNSSLDGVVVCPEDYVETQSTGATGMVRGFVEAGLSRMKSRPSQPVDTSETSTTRGCNRRSDTITIPPDQSSSHVKACGLCKTEFTFFVRRNTCQQCHRVVCSDCLTKKQIDHVVLMALEAEREAKEQARVQEEAVANLAVGADNNQNELDANDSSRSGLQQCLSDSAVPVGTEPVVQPGQRSQSYTQETNTGGFGSGWRAIKGNTDSGYGRMDKLCDPCYLGLSSDQVKVLESGGGWEYYQATLSKNQTQDIAAALAVSHLDGKDNADDEAA